MCPSYPRESDLIRLVAGELSEEDRARVTAHVSGCARCAEARRQLLATWEALDADAIVPPGNDLTDRVLTAAQRPARAAYWPQAARVAATVLLAVGAGVVAGVLAPARQPVVTAPQVPTQEVVTGLGLDLLSDDMPGLAQLVTHEQSQEDQL